MTAEGDIYVEHTGPIGKSKLMIQNILHVPGISSNLVSVSAIAKKGFKIVFTGDMCEILNPQGKQVMNGYLNTNNVYKFSLKSLPPKTGKLEGSSTAAMKVTCDGNINLWHRRLAHLNQVYLNQLMKQAATGIVFDQEQLSQCEICATGKLTRKPFQLNTKRAIQPLQLVHSDLCQVDDLSLGKARYFITFLDDFSRKIFIFL